MSTGTVKVMYDIRCSAGHTAVTCPESRVEREITEFECGVVSCQNGYGGALRREVKVRR
jgi:hypothetical protein